MAKIEVINVTISSSVEDMVSAHIAKLTGKAEKLLDSAIIAQKKIQEQKANSPQNKMKNIMDKIYTDLEEAGEHGINGNDLLISSEGLISNLSALTTRLKTLLRKNGNVYRLVRKKDQYIFEPFNKRD